MYHYAGNNPINYIDPDGRFEKQITVYNNTKTVSFNELVEMGDKKRKELKANEAKQSWWDGFLTVLGFVPGVDELADFAGVLTELSGFAPDNTKKVNDRFYDIYREISLESQKIDANGQKKSPDVKVEITTEITAKNYDSIGKGSVLYIVPMIDCSSTVKVTIDITINGVKQEPIIYTDKTTEYWIHAKSYEDFSWTKGLILIPKDDETK